MKENEKLKFKVLCKVTMYFYRFLLSIHNQCQLLYCVTFGKSDKNLLKNILENIKSLQIALMFNCAISKVIFLNYYPNSIMLPPKMSIQLIFIPLSRALLITVVKFFHFVVVDLVALKCTTFKWFLDVRFRILDTKAFVHDICVNTTWSCGPLTVALSLRFSLINLWNVSPFRKENTRGI